MALPPPSTFCFIYILQLELQVLLLRLRASVMLLLYLSSRLFCSCLLCGFFNRMCPTHAVSTYLLLCYYFCSPGRPRYNDTKPRQTFFPPLRTLCRALSMNDTISTVSRWDQQQKSATTDCAKIRV